MGCQSIQGQQGYFSSSIQSKDIYCNGIQGNQASFNFIGCQSLIGTQAYFSSNLDVGTANNPTSTITYEMTNISRSTTIKKFGVGSLDFTGSSPS
jgi:hypothetical protein